jgi:hypothetical protein
MRDAIGVWDTGEAPRPRVLQELAAPAWPADRLSAGSLWRTRPPISRRQGAQQPCDHNVHAPRPRGCLGGRHHTPRRLARLETAGLDATARLSRITGPTGLVSRSLGQEERLACRPNSAMVPRADHDRVQGGGREGAAVRLAPGLGRPLPRVGTQPGKAADCGLQPLGAGGCAGSLPHRMRPAVLPVPAAAWAWASIVTARCSVAGTTTRLPRWSSHPQAVPAHRPRSKTTGCRHAWPVRGVRWRAAGSSRAAASADAPGALGPARLPAGAPAASSGARPVRPTARGGPAVSRGRVTAGVAGRRFRALVRVRPRPRTPAERRGRPGG